MGIPDRLKIVRGTLSQTEFAKRIGSSQSTVSGCEKGKQRPDSELIKKICNEFSVNPIWLLFGTGSVHMKEVTVQTGDTSPVLPASSPAQPIENITSKKTKTGDMSPVWEVQRELTDALKKRAEAQERIVELTQENAELRLQLQERDMRIHELEKENAGLREAQKGSAPVFRAATGDVG